MNKNIWTQINFKSLIHMTINNLKSVLNQLRTYSHVGLGQIGLKLVWHVLVASHDGQIDWNWFQIDLKVSCEQGVYDKCEQGSELGQFELLRNNPGCISVCKCSVNVQNSSIETFFILFFYYFLNKYFFFFFFYKMCYFFSKTFVFIYLYKKYSI